MRQNTAGGKDSRHRGLHPPPKKPGTAKNSRRRTASRRCFLKGAAGGVGGLLILPSARTAFAYHANERLRLAVVGMAGNLYLGY